MIKFHQFTTIMRAKIDANVFKKGNFNDYTTEELFKEFQRYTDTFGINIANGLEFKNKEKAYEAINSLLNVANLSYMLASKISDQIGDKVLE